MGKIVCEVCGSDNLVKKDGLFVCSSCGTKYTLDEVRKQLAGDETSLQSQPSGISVSNKETLTNLYIVARRAWEDKQYEKAQKYYEQIGPQDPHNWEPEFYSRLSGCYLGTVGEIQLNAIRATDCAITAIGMMENVEETDKAKVLDKIYMDTQFVLASLYTSAKSVYQSADAMTKLHLLQGYVDQRISISKQFFLLGDTVKKIDNKKPMGAWKLGIDIYSTVIPEIKEKAGNIAIITPYIEEVKQLDPTYVPPKMSDSNIGDTIIKVIIAIIIGTTVGIWIASSIFG